MYSRELLTSSRELYDRELTFELNKRNTWESYVYTRESLYWLNKIMNMYSRESFYVFSRIVWLRINSLNPAKGVLENHILVLKNLKNEIITIRTGEHVFSRNIYVFLRITCVMNIIQSFKRICKDALSSQLSDLVYCLLLWSLLYCKWPFSSWLHISSSVTIVDVFLSIILI